MLNIIQNLIESLGVVLLGYSLLGVRWDLGKQLVYTIIFSFIVVLLRSLPMPYGIHALITLLVLGVMLKFITQKPLPKAMTASAIILTVLILAESLTLELFIHLINVDPSELRDSQQLWFWAGLPHSFVLLALACYFNKRKPRILSKIGL